MDSSDDDPFHPCPLSSSTKEEYEKVLENNNVEDLLEEGWFFGKVLSKKPAGGMFRCYSDPSPNFDQRLLADNNHPMITTSSSKNAANLIRTPSLPPCIGRRGEIVEDKDQTRRRRSSGSSSNKISKLNRQLSDLSLVLKSNKEQPCMPNVSFPRQKLITPQSSKRKLLRTPSLPSPCIGREQVADEEDDSDITMGRLICEAISSSSEILPPRSHSSKGMTQSYGMQKNRSARNLKELGYPNQRNLKKSLSDLETQEVQGFKDLGFRCNQRDLNPSVVAILPPGLQDKKKQDEDKEVKMPCLSEAWYAKTYAPPPIPIWANKIKTEDMKLQIKYWARAVASNAR